jgi:hypothetical protein
MFFPWFLDFFHVVTTSSCNHMVACKTHMRPQLNMVNIVWLHLQNFQWNFVSSTKMCNSTWSHMVSLIYLQSSMIIGVCSCCQFFGGAKLRLENDIWLAIGGAFSSNIINNVVQGLQFNTSNFNVCKLN